MLTQRLQNWTGWLATFVVNQDGEHTGSDGSSKTISNNFDLQLLLSLRSKTDVIVTTGETARKENYKSSRHAPIAFLTRNPASLSGIPAVTNAGFFENYFLSEHEEAVFDHIEKSLSDLGFQAFLFEGGRRSLAQLLNSVKDVRFVLSITPNGVQNPARPETINPLQILKTSFGNSINSYSNLSLEDDFIVGTNRVIAWFKPAL